MSRITPLGLTGEGERTEDDTLIVRMGRLFQVRVDRRWLPWLLTAVGLGGTTVMYQRAEPAAASPVRLEQRVDALEKEMKGTREAIVSLERRLVSRELKQAWQWRWDAQIAGDGARVKNIDEDINALSRELEGPRR